MKIETSNMVIVTTRKGKYLHLMSRSGVRIMPQEKITFRSKEELNEDSPIVVELLLKKYKLTERRFDTYHGLLCAELENTSKFPWRVYHKELDLWKIVSE